MNSPIPEEVRTARKAAGLSQAKFGALVFSAVRTVQQWEKGDRDMHPGLWQLAQIKINAPTSPADPSPHG